MTSLSDWSDIIRRQGEESRALQDKLLEQLKNEMPEAVKKLPDHTNEDLLLLYDQFTGGRVDPREVVLREEFREHIKTEIFKRMSK